MNYSVLMSVYHKENPVFLQQSIESILAQTIKTNDLVLVCDGPLNTELDAMIVQMQCKVGPIMQVIRLEKNSGLGAALNVGLKYCKNGLIARMDTDDIAYPDRCEKQLAIFEKMDVDIVSGTVEEFVVSPDVISARRVLPQTQEEILRFAKKRSPFNHACVMYRKSAVENAGGYQDFFLLEDYYLWVRMLMNGSKGYNIQEPLLWVRIGNGMYGRRGGENYAKSQRKLFRYMKENGFISITDYWEACTIRTVFSFIPNWMRALVYKKVLRK